MSLGIGIIGCGLIGQKRAKALGKGRLIACADINIVKAEDLGKKFNVQFFDSWKKLLELPEVDVVIVATLHDSLALITYAAIKTGKHVLVEKPAARNTKELEPLIELAKTKKCKSKGGF